MKKLTKLIELRLFLRGKKSYLILGVSVTIGILQTQGVVIPEYVYILLAGVLGITFKLGSNRIEIIARELAKRDCLREINKEKQQH